MTSNELQSAVQTASSGTDVLIRHPAFGSLWLTNAHVEGPYVIGEAWDDSQVGSSLLPDDFMGEPVIMNFPVGCVVRWA